MSVRSGSKQQRKRFLAVKAVVLATFLSLPIGQQAFAQTPVWASEFVGQLTFTLMDDPAYKRDYESMIALEQELMRIRQILSDKRAALENNNNAKAQAVSQLEATQFSITEKTDLKDKTNLEIDSLENQIQAIENKILANNNIIQNKQNEIDLLNDQIEFFQKVFDEAVLSEDIMKRNYETKLNDCLTNNPGVDCTVVAEVTEAKKKYDKSILERQQAEDQITGLTDLADKAKEERDAAVADNETQATSKNSAVSSKEQKEALVATLINEIPQLQTLANKLTDDIGEYTMLITQLIEDEQRLSDLDAVNALNFERADSQFKRLELELTEAIIKLNKQGVKAAELHGGNEGMDLASSLGNREGTSQGESAGSNSGEADGRERDFQVGAKQGEVEGSDQGKTEGRKEGLIQGELEGNKIAGQRDGQADGIARAEKSDASTVGKTEGKIAGKEKAEIDGESTGRKKGEKESIDKNENIQLRQVIANGKFASTFSGNLPAFPGAQGKYFNNNVQDEPKQILRLAYTAGYNATYNFAAETVYNTNIQQIFDQAYKLSYDSSYQTSFNVTYDDSIREGRATQFQAAYDREFNIAKPIAFNEARDNTIKNPNTASVTYKNAYKTSETSSFNQRYAEIKKVSFDQAFKVTYDQNIGPATEKHRKIRIAEVDKIYSNFPILKFVSSTLNDDGQSAVGSRDGVFQAGEATSMDMVFANYGKKAAMNVKVMTSSGKTFVLPEIQGQSVVTVRGAVSERISNSASIGSKKSVSTTSIMKLTSTEKAIQGRHFENVSSGVIDSRNKKTVSINNPFSINAVELSDAVVLNKINKIIAKVQNNSKRAYVGPIDVEISSSLGKAIIIKDADKISSINRSATNIVEGAELLINDAKEIFSEVNFSVKVSKNGVTLAKTKGMNEQIVQMPFVDIPGAPVIALSSQTRESRQLFKDIASELGGAQNVSILDLNNNEQNKRTLEKLKKKTVIVVGNRSSQVEKQLNELFAGRDNVAIFINELTATDSMSRAISANANLRAASTLAINLASRNIRVTTSNKFAANKVKERVSMIQGKSSELSKLIEIAELLKLNNQELIKKAGELITVEALQTRDQDAINLAKMITSRIVEEIQLIDITCSTRKDCRKLKSTIKTSQELLVNQLIDAVENNLQGANGVALIASSIEDIVKSFNKKDTVSYRSLRSPFKKRVKTLRKASEKLAKKTVGKKPYATVADSAGVIMPILNVRLK